jgi:hypothetical protein
MDITFFKYSGVPKYFVCVTLEFGIIYCAPYKNFNWLYSF